MQKYNCQRVVPKEIHKHSLVEYSQNLYITVFIESAQDFVEPIAILHPLLACENVVITEKKTLKLMAEEDLEKTVSTLKNYRIMRVRDRLFRPLSKGLFYCQPEIELKNSTDLFAWFNLDAFWLNHPFFKQKPPPPQPQGWPRVSQAFTLNFKRSDPDESKEHSLVEYSENVYLTVRVERANGTVELAILHPLLAWENVVITREKTLKLLSDNLSQADISTDSKNSYWKTFDWTDAPSEVSFRESMVINTTAEFSSSEVHTENCSDYQTARDYQNYSSEKIPNCETSVRRTLREKEF
ncbi:hypothetical protein L596_011672 [Steinernema carpocapsae]|uniref:Uncharacterized protein n=1 Tax=Steinernema carpocapsae TaxID=34508 RepID=A0A4U5NVF2_STECR|nr:hypothetical protein L596_011672 [Steinernema carpocapsae]